MLLEIINLKYAYFTASSFNILHACYMTLENQLPIICYSRINTKAATKIYIS